MLRNNTIAISYIQRFFDVFTPLFCGYILYILQFREYLLSIPYFITFAISATLLLICFHFSSLYQSWRGYSIFKEISFIFFPWVVFFALLISIGFVTKHSTIFSRQWTLSWFFAGFVSLVLERIIVRYCLSKLRGKGWNSRSVCLLAFGNCGKRAFTILNNRKEFGFNLTAIFADDAGFAKEEQYKGKIAGVVDFIKQNNIDQLWIATPLSYEKKLKHLLYELRHETIDIRYIPDIFGFRLLNHKTMDIDGVPVINLTATPFEGDARFIKSVEDFILAGIILILISPVMLILALLIKLTSAGPVLFKQNRHGCDGEPITIWKFRSMYEHKEDYGEVTQATRHDSRITKIGVFMRKTSLDELPQFINVLQGKMSIVGPRPHAVLHNEYYKELVDSYMLRHKVKPGITGWAQINGFRGETNTIEKMQKRIEYDLYYIEHWSLWLDFRIILLTTCKGFWHKNAY